MEKDFLSERRKGLEDEFFRRQEAALLQRLRDEEARRRAREALAAASHITNEVLLDQLAAFGIEPETLTVVSLVPLVEIAWADGTVERAERQAVLAAAKQMGVGEAGTGHRLLASCLSKPPPAHLRGLWTHYIQNLCATLSAAEREALKVELLERLRSVAEAAGGFIGLGSRISASEERLIADFARAFEAGAVQHQECASR